MVSEDAFRLAEQATFGPTEKLLTSLQSQSASHWVAQQMKLSKSSYSSGNGGAVHQNTSTTDFCSLSTYAGDTCWRDWRSTVPLVWDFYQNAVNNDDQLRQRVALALQQITVVSGLEVEGTYGFRNYQNNLLSLAFGNYRDVLRKVALSPVMGDYLNSVNNNKDAPNENFARELLQLFSIGTCTLNTDGSLKGGSCAATYDNETVRNYAYALTGWTYPAGGSSSSGCWPSGSNCRYYGGDMTPLANYHDTTERALLSGVTVPSGSTASQALELVLDSIMQHGNTAPFLGKQLIQHLVTSNPSSAYVTRVAQAFQAGSYTSSDGKSFGTGTVGDLSATVAAVLLDSEARGSTPTSQSTGRLREPAQMFAGVLRALNGKTDGDAFTWWWGDALQQHLFRSPSVFNFYAPDYPVAGTSLNGPAFGILNSATGIQRLNFLTTMVFNGGVTASTTVPDATGTTLDLTGFESSASDAGTLVDRLSALCCTGRLSTDARTTIVSAVETIGANSSTTWQRDRVRQAAYLLFASPAYQIQR
jgi:uncharacterized protein (DUF1800 family)